ncbi:hypothetical protein [Candidatus Accumulibacter sp. ACC007]|uniref:hypothetical protein n=1 Tax=Candidatus Accumulibacter sp. ACC007 TaxID=2823333 RepID=UPI0025C68BD0|nr:hypothetical protein [Candidatus Accumulibacter sp. ACC007]
MILPVRCLTVRPLWDYVKIVCMRLAACFSAASSTPDALTIARALSPEPDLF